MSRDTTNPQPGVPAGVTPGITPISGDQFTQSDPRRLYARLRPDQRTAIAGEFLRLFRLSGDPEALRFDTPIEGMLPPERVAELHTYARQHHPEILEQVRDHPVTQAALAAPGAEVEEPAEREEVVVREGGAPGAESLSAQSAESGPTVSEDGAYMSSQALANPETLGGRVLEDTAAGATDTAAEPGDQPERR